MDKETEKKKIQSGEIQIYFDDNSKLELLRFLTEKKGYCGTQNFYTKISSCVIPFKHLPIIKISEITEETSQIKVFSEEVLNTPGHYDNSKGTLYKVAKERNWNPYLFDIVKRLERAEKKGEFKTDLEKSINVIKLWLKESETK